MINPSLINSPDLDSWIVLDADGTVPVLDGVGLDFDYDWDFIERNWTAHFIYI